MKSDLYLKHTLIFIIIGVITFIFSGLHFLEYYLWFAVFYAYICYVINDVADTYTDVSMGTIDCCINAIKEYDRNNNQKQETLSELNKELLDDLNKRVNILYSRYSLRIYRGGDKSLPDETLCKTYVVRRIKDNLHYYYFIYHNGESWIHEDKPFIFEINDQYVPVVFKELEDL